MCSCGRKRTQAVTSAQTAQAQADVDSAESVAIVKELAMQTVTEAERYLQSATRAIGNANS